TDLPRCFPEILATWLRVGKVKVSNPFNGRERLVELKPEFVHTLVLWSKDYSALLEDVGGLREQLTAYNQIFFHFSITGLGGTLLEPGIIPFEEAVHQFRQLIALAGEPKRVNWRFDPIVFWREGGDIRSNLEVFEKISAAASAAGLCKVTVSLCQWYKKARCRAREYKLYWVTPEVSQTKEIAEQLQAMARKNGMEVMACCTPGFTPFGIKPERCIDGELLTKLHPQKEIAASKKDTGQRPDCGCALSVDIGSYQMACTKGCVYCYANPK
ncbi:DUF1848 family protein, partial [bacterium]|nr:DUF1848 family protein [bacterium]